MGLETEMSKDNWKPVVFENNSERILGILHESEKKVSLSPGIVMCHGFTGQKVEPHRLFVKMARALAGSGFYALRFDFRGSGDSDGNFVNTTISGEISDTLQAVEYLANQEGIDKERIGLLGLSFGGSVAACASWRDMRIKAISLWSAIADLPSVFQAKIEPDKMKEFSKTGYYDYDGDVVGAGFIRELGKFKPLDEISRFKGSVLIIHGDADEVVPIENARKFENVLKGREKVVIIKGAGHTFDSEVWERQVINTTLKWFKGILV